MSGLIPQEIEAYLSLKYEAKELIRRLCLGCGWGFGYGSVMETFPDLSNHNISDRIGSLEALPRCWREMRGLDLWSSGDKWIYWIPRDVEELKPAWKKYAADLIDEELYKVTWLRRDSNFILRLTFESDLTLEAEGVSGLECGLRILSCISFYERRLRMPSLSSLRGDVELREKGLNGEPTVVADLDMLSWLNAFYAEYKISKGYFCGDYLEYNQYYLGQIELLEGYFHLIGTKRHEPS